MLSPSKTYQSMYASFSQPSPGFTPGIKVNCTQVYSTNTDHKVCLCPVSDKELIVADRGGRLSSVKIFADSGCSQAEVSDNNNGKPILDVFKAPNGKLFFIDSERVQLKVSVSKHQAQTVLTNVCSDADSRGKILRYFEKGNCLYVKGNEQNTIIVYNLDSSSIQQEFFVAEAKQGREIADFCLNPFNGDVLAVTDRGDIVFRGTNPARADAFYKFGGREGEVFCSLAVDWSAGVLTTVGTQTLEKQLHQHVVYVYDIKDTSNVTLISKSKIWQTKDPQFKDKVSHVRLHQIEDYWYVCCFTDATSSLVVFRYSPNYQTLDLVSYPQKLAKSGKTFDVKQAFGNFYACFDNQDLAVVNIHSPSF